MSTDHPQSWPDPSGSLVDLDSRIVAALERITHVMHRALWHAAWSAKMSPSQAQFLVYLHYQGKDKPVNLRELSERFGLRHSTVSDAVTALETKGYLRRVPDPQDGRAVLLTLTPKGQRAAGRLAVWADVVRRQLADLSAERKAIFLETLLNLIARLQAAGLISVVRTCTTCHYFQANVHPNPKAPHHCRLMDRPLALVELRVDCPDHIAAGTSAH